MTKLYYMKDINSFKLTNNVTVEQAKEWMRLKDENSKAELIELIYHRFENRYVKHIKSPNSGFLKMAVGCFVIETLESFKQGIEDTTHKSGDMFRDFFSSEREFFPGFKELGKDFFKSIRCGILHQGETTNGWRILLKGELLNLSERSINASKFIESLEGALSRYIQNLRDSDFDSDIWRNALKKLEDIIINCGIRRRHKRRY